MIEFNLRGNKLHLSSILDTYGRYIVSYNVSSSPNSYQITDMLAKAFETNSNIKKLIIHSEHGWQYQHKFYSKRLEEKNVTQSMSRKGNCLDNAVMEKFLE